MRAVIAPDPGGPDALRMVELPDPHPGRGEVLVAVAASAVNRADLLQRRGMYAPPAGVTKVLGLEASGTIEAVGEGETRSASGASAGTGHGGPVSGWAVGDQVCAVLPGGGYAERVVVPAAVAMPLPPGVDVVAAGAVPEVFATAYDNVFLRGGLQRSETLLVHGGASGVGTAAIQLAKRAGCRVLVSAGSVERVDACVKLGADAGVVYHDDDWADQVLSHTDGRGVDVVLDIVGGPYLASNLRCLATEGRLVVIGLMGGATAELNLGVLLSKRVAVMGSTLRARTTGEKAPLMRRLVEDVWPGFSDGSLRPVIDRTYRLEQAAEAHRALEEEAIFGKIVLEV